MTKKYIQLGFYLAGLVIVLFLGTYYFYIDKDFYLTSIQINVFFLPGLFTGTCLFYLLRFRKQQHISFRTLFKELYILQFIAGSISLSCIMIYLNYINVDAGETFNNQYYDTWIQNLDPDYETTEPNPVLTDEQREDQKEVIKEGLLKAKNDKVKVLSFKNTAFLGFVFLINLFYLIVSVILSWFYKFLPK